MERRLVAYMKHYEMPNTTVYNEKKPLLFINSGELKRLRIAKRLKDGTLVFDAVQPLIAYVLENNIQLLIVDPFAETHPAGENSNEDIVTVAAMFRQVAQKGNCAVILVHHSRKPEKSAGQGGGGGDMNLSRGASSLLGVARSVWTLTNITEKEAATFNIPENERHLYVVFEQAKANMAAPGSNKKYFKRNSVTLRLAPDDIDGEKVGILEPVELDEVQSSKMTSRETKLLQIIKETTLELKADTNGIVIIPRINIKEKFDHYLDHEPGKDKLPTPHTKRDALRKGLLSLKAKGVIKDFNPTEIHFAVTPQPHETPHSATWDGAEHPTDTTTPYKGCGDVGVDILI